MTTTAGRRHHDTYEHLVPLFAEHDGLPVDDPKRGPLRARLIDGYQPVARHIAHRYDHGEEGVDDLTQVATLGLIHAVDRFEPGRGVDFLAFAVPTITGEVLRHFRDRSTTIRVPRRLRELQSRIHPAVAELGQRLGRAPRPSEIAAELGVDRALVREALAAMDVRRPLSLDGRPDGEGGTSADRPPYGAALGRPEPNLALVEQRESLRPLLAALPEREQTVLVLRFFCGQTQSEIGQALGMSQMHVSRMLARTLAALRSRLTAD